jgi:hypothetical protein
MLKINLEYSLNLLYLYSYETASFNAKINGVAFHNHFLVQIM